MSDVLTWGGQVLCLRCGSQVARTNFIRHVGSRQCREMAKYRLRDLLEHDPGPVPQNVAALAGQYLRELRSRKAAHA